MSPRVASVPVDLPFREPPRAGAGSPTAFSASMAIHVLVLLLVTTTWSFSHRASQKPVRVNRIEILQAPHPERTRERSTQSKPLPRETDLVKVPQAPPQPALKGPPPPFQFELDSGLPQQLPLVLTRWNGCLGFGRASEPKTIRVRVCGPELDERQIYADCQLPGDFGYEVRLDDADRWDFVRQARARCAECSEMANVWALFPYAFGEALEDRLRAGVAAQTPGTPAGSLIVRFDSGDRTGVAVRKGTEE